MIESEGYKAFHGIMRITPIVPRFEPFEIEADWLYKPDTDCWYGNCRSFDSQICTVVRETEKEENNV